jgi:hypothetical protein
MSKERADSIRDTYREGNTVPCFIDPENPRRTILFKDGSDIEWLRESTSIPALLGSFLLPAGIAWLIFLGLIAIRRV